MLMRTTIDLPDELHGALLHIARHRHQSLDRTIADLLRRALAGGQRSTGVETDEQTGMPLVRLGRHVTAESVARAQDEV